MDINWTAIVESLISGAGADALKSGLGSIKGMWGGDPNPKSPHESLPLNTPLRKRLDSFICLYDPSTGQIHTIDEELPKEKHFSLVCREPIKGHLYTFQNDKDGSGKMRLMPLVYQGNHISLPLVSKDSN